MVGLAWMTVLELIACFKPRDSLFGGTYRAYQVLDSGDLITIALALAGVVYLSWLGSGLLSGRIRAGLAGDFLQNERIRS
jgi:hypothetical protein